MKIKLRIVLIALWLLGSCHAADEQMPPWNLDKLSAPPKVYDAPEMPELKPEAGIRGLFFEGLPYKGKPTRVFAWYGVPPSDGNKVPAMVLIHGGGGSAFMYWVKLWNSRGYAAIAMDTCGCLPGSDKGGGVKRPRHEFGGPPGWGGYDQMADALEDQWAFHAVADVILAHSLIRSFPEIDADRIGVTGISWGGYLTCIVSGVDSRFKFAVPVYGCGFFGESERSLLKFEKMGEENTAVWLRRWDPKAYLGESKMPMLWVSGTNDFAFPMDSLQKSYRLPKGERNIALRVRMPHGHDGPGEKPEEIRVFADSILMGGKPLAKIVEQGQNEKIAWVKFDAPVAVTKAELNYTKDVGVWQKRKWETLPAKIDGTKASADIPDGTTVFYLNVVDERGTIASSQHVELKKQ